MRPAILACLLCLGVPAGAAGEPNWGAWAEEVRNRHPLAGSIYDVALDALTRPLPPNGRGPVLREGIVLLGEVHDNPLHHRLRAWLIENSGRTSREWRPAIVFEQIRADQQPALDQFKALTEAGGGTADDLFRFLELDKTGWPPAAMYKPLFEAAIAAKLPIVAGDPPQGRVRVVARGGLSSIPPEERAHLQLDAPMPGMLLDALRKDLVNGHCGVLPAEAVDGMAMAQRYRDAHLADAVLAAAKRHGSAILIAGNGHARSDRGVPWHIRERAPGTKLAAILLVEVEEGKTEPAGYVPRDPTGKAAADLVIFTPRAERGDPCEGMQKSKR